MQENKASLLGKILSSREVSPKGLLGALQQSWKSTKFRIKRIAGNLFQFFFDDINTLSSIIEDGPRCFENHLIILKRWQPNWESNPFLFNSTEFWVHLVKYPSHYYTIEVGRQIMTDWTACISGQLRERRNYGGRFFRFRISVDVTKPIRRFYCLQLPGTVSTRGLIQYERLPKLCKNCGLQSHTVNFCPQRTKGFTASELVHLPYRDWLSTTNNSTLLYDLAGLPKEYYPHNPRTLLLTAPLNQTPPTPKTIT